MHLRAQEASYLLKNKKISRKPLVVIPIISIGVGRLQYLQRKKAS